MEPEKANLDAVNLLTKAHLLVLQILQMREQEVSK
jgi:hypothetical protein